MNMEAEIEVYLWKGTFHVHLFLQVYDPFLPMPLNHMKTLPSSWNNMLVARRFVQRLISVKEVGSIFLILPPIHG